MADHWYFEHHLRGSPLLYHDLYRRWTPNAASVESAVFWRLLPPVFR